jgi:hypothetical protein
MEEIKEKPGRGGRRAGAGRPPLEFHKDGERKETKSITLSKEDWEFLRSHASNGSLSTAVFALVELARDPRSKPLGWLPSARKFADPGPVRAAELEKASGGQPKR